MEFTGQNSAFGRGRSIVEWGGDCVVVPVFEGGVRTVELRGDGFEEGVEEGDDGKGGGEEGDEESCEGFSFCHPVQFV